jgi:hypothetical protein
VSDNCTVEQFLHDVADHKLTILKDDGVNRHIRLSRDGSYTYRFEIITSPGILVISGDMGANIFARIEDMFRFFREDITPVSIPINRGYWHEKIQVRRGDSYKFTAEQFERVVRGHLEDIRDEVEDFDALMEKVEEELFGYGDDERSSREALSDFEWNEETLFHDTWEWDFCDFTYHYTWQCYAIVWAIAQYDAAKEKEVQP